MKKLFFYLCVLMSVTIHAEDTKYMQAMQKAVTMLDSAKDEAAFQNAYNTFERIGNANPAEWLPLYYQSFSSTMIGLGQKENSKKDEYLDKASTLADKADSLSPNNSEIAVLQSFVNSMKITVDPMTRGQKYGMQSSMLIQKAIKLDPENPRAYFLK